MINALNYKKNYNNFIKMKDSEDINNIFSIVEKVNEKFYITKDGKDYNPTRNIDWVYQTQDMLAMQALIALKTSRAYQAFFDNIKYEDALIDIGSRFNSACLFSSLFMSGLYYIELTEMKEAKEINIKIVQSEAQNLPFSDNCASIITSLHAIEHFGLGRYGNSIDYYGDYKGLKEMHRILRPGGFLITSIPCTSKSSRIDYHTERIYNVNDYNEMMQNLNFDIVDDYTTLSLIRMKSKKECQEGIIDNFGSFIEREKLGLCIIPIDDMNIAWNLEELEAAENKNIRHSAYLSVWRKK